MSDETSPENRAYYRAILSSLPLKDQRFLLAMDAADEGDEMAAVLRAMTLVEYYVETALRRAFVRNQRMRMEELPFAWKRKFAIALGLLPERIDRPMKLLANLRNSFGHDPEIMMQPKDVTKLVNSLDGHEKVYYNVISGDGGLYKRCSADVRRLRCFLTVLERTMFYETMDKEEDVVDALRTADLRLHASSSTSLADVSDT